MPVSMPRVMSMAWLLSACVLAPSSSWALGLGEIHLNSALNEPMNAEIDLIAAAPDELNTLHAALASREAFTRYGIDKPPFLSTLTFKVGKSKDGRDALMVRSADSIPEPFVTFLVEVTWARGRLMREYTVLLDPPVYAPSESAAPVTAPSTAAAPAPRRQPPPITPSLAPPPVVKTPAAATAAPGSVRVGRGDTLSKIVRNLDAGAPEATVDQTMMALFRANPAAFGGNINVLHEGALLKVPSSDEVATLDRKQAIGEVHRQIEAWKAGETAGTASGHLRLVAPGAAGSASGVGSGGGAGAKSPGTAENQALQDKVKTLEGQLADSKRLIEIRNNELSALQRKLATSPPPNAAPPAAAPPAPAVAPPKPVQAVRPPAAAPSPSPSVQVPEPPPAVVVAPKKPAEPTAAEGGSWIDWMGQNWWAPAALLVLALIGLGSMAMRRRRAQNDDMSRLMQNTDVAEPRGAAAKSNAARRTPEAFLVEESGARPALELPVESTAFGDTSEVKTADDTLSSETAVNIDQGDPLAEADFHMAYGLYDQAADLVRIALEREPDRRDLRLKLLEIYFVWGNKDLFLQTAKGLEATRDRAPAGEWDKIVIMGKQICPAEPMFTAGPGGLHGAGAPIDLNLEGGENRVDIDLFGDPDGERSTLDHRFNRDDQTAALGEPAGLGASSDHLDFMLDAPERGADDSPTRQMPPRDEPTVESELMNFRDANFIDPPGFNQSGSEAVTAESPALREADRRDRIAARLPPKTDQTAEMSIEDLGLDLGHLDDEASPGMDSFDGGHSQHGATHHPADAPTMVAGLDERSRAMMADAEKNTHDRDLTELERELDASFISDLGSAQDGSKTGMFGPESAPTVLMSREGIDLSPTSRFRTPDAAKVPDLDKSDTESTSKLRGMNSDSIDLDLDRLSSALGGNGSAHDTAEHPSAEEDLFSTEVFEGSQTSRRVDLDVGAAPNGSDVEGSDFKIQTSKLKPLDIPMPDLEPVTMSEVGTKLDLARAYMDMGDPEGARSILEEVVQEGSASQKQEASRLIESLPG